MKKLLVSGAVALSLLFSPFTVTAAEQKQDTQQVSIIKDGMYDNHNAFVDESKYSLEKILESVEIIGHDVEYTLSYETLDGKIYSANKQISTRGSGVVIEKKDGKAYILTNNHLTEEFVPVNLNIDTPCKWLRLEKTSDRVYIVKRGIHYESKVTAKVLVSDSSLDIALLEVADSASFKKFPYKIGNSDDLRPGDFIWVVGNPLGLEDYTLGGDVSKLDYPSNSDWFMIGTSVQSGYSGGAVIAIRDGEYELVGIVVATLIRPDDDSSMYDALGGYGIAIKINPAMKIVEKYLK